jgi:endoglucanase
MFGGRVVLVVLLAAVLLVAGSSNSNVAEASGNPLAGVRLYVDHHSPAWHQMRVYRRSGQRRKAALIRRIAREPRALWFGRFTRPHFRKKVRRQIVRAKRRTAVPVLTVLRAEANHCGPWYTGGGPAEDARTRAWYRRFARRIGRARVVIAFEPDSLGTIDCQARSRRDDRIRLLRYGVKRFARLPNATVYLDAGASDWEPARRTARQLRAIGIARVRGFMLNATHYDWTRANIRHGLRISRLTGGKHFVIDTSGNGRGPVHYRRSNGRRITVWCNPGMRGLGTPPTTSTSNPMVDAYLWINRPGYTQRCQGRRIAWYAPRALAYARHATHWEGPPRGSRYGYRKRYPFSMFARSR